MKISVPNAAEVEHYGGSYTKLIEAMKAENAQLKAERDEARKELEWQEERNVNNTLANDADTQELRAAKLCLEKHRPDCEGLTVEKSILRLLSNIALHVSSSAHWADECEKKDAEIAELKKRLQAVLDYCQ